jgi:D-glycero-alpha-D-manno-heptose-7-phosphate kinase
LFGPKRQIEIVSMADLPARTGLGSSATFTVGLLNAIYSINRSSISAQALAETAFKIQTEILGEVGGKQDQYAAAFGGFLSLKIDRSGKVTVRELSVSDDVVEELENNLLCFYTGVQRESSGIQKSVVDKANASTPDSKSSSEATLHKIKSLSARVERALVSGNLSEFGNLLHTHWLLKRSLSSSISSTIIDRLYEKALKAGAIGGKIMGAGGGGFMVFYCENHHKAQLKKEMISLGLKEVKLRFDQQGSKIVANI